VQLSAEIRWFGEGDVPREIDRWFRAVEPEAQQPRTDLYRPGNPEMGIKKRGGGAGVEVKGLVSELSPVALPGRAQLWCKWSTDGLDFSDGITVEKQRWLRQLPGCNLELTTLVVGGQRWWTVGFEAFGDLHEAEPRLRAACAAVADGAPPLGLSLSYAEWLTRFAAPSPSA
jgi:hypothetical protein